VAVAVAVIITIILLEPVDQPASIRIIADNVLPSIAPRRHVIDGTQW
jgi:hypothetical protein